MINDIFIYETYFANILVHDADWIFESHLFNFDLKHTPVRIIYVVVSCPTEQIHDSSHVALNYDFNFRLQLFKAINFNAI